MAEYDEEGNPFTDIDKCIEDTNAIVPPRVEAATFKVEHGLILMLKEEGCFRNSTDDDPTQHLRNFLGVCAMHKQNNVSDDALILRVFKYSLVGEARKWIQNLPPHSIHSWPELVRAFLAKWFPQSKKSELKDKIFFFKQLPGEHLHEVWDRFKLYLVRSPNHGFSDKILLEKFYMGLDQLNQSIAKNVADGLFMDKTFTRITQILDKMAEHNQAWHSEDTTGGIAYGTPSLTNMIKENQERDQVITDLATNIHVLTKIFPENQTKNVNVVEDVQPLSNEDCEEANYVHNSQGAYRQQNQWRPDPQGQGHQQWHNDQGGSSQGNWSNNNNNYANRSSNPYVPQKGQYSNSSYYKEGSSSESKLESILERILQNQERGDTIMKNMAELVGSHTVSIQKLEIQMRDLSREHNPKPKGRLPSDTIANPKGNGSGPTSHCMAITTRSRKVLQGENEQIVGVDDLEQEVEAQVEVRIVIEVEKIPKEVKVQEENHKRVKEKAKETPKALVEIPRPSPPFPQRLARRVDDSKFEKFYDILKQLSVNIPFVEAFQEMRGFAKYLKDLITKKRTTKNEVVNVTHQFSSIIATTTIEKKEDPGAFSIPCTIGLRDFARALCDNGASINLMPLTIYKQAGLSMQRPTSMRLQMADRSIKRPVGIIDDVLVKVVKFLLPTDFVILDCAVDKEIPIILGRSFLTTGRALMDLERNEIKFRVNDEEVTFQANKGMKLPHAYEGISVIDFVDEVEDASEIKMEEECLGESLAAILVNFDGENMEGYMESMNAL
ncbi:uncharacterized protein [Nicotiana tomentosiformis]|uniref:uncharacterized protein n=1 Tax=Nicotiana tomentosiformis TaxID=4098 RepID=UPI00388CE73A